MHSAPHKMAQVCIAEESESLIGMMGMIGMMRMMGMIGLIGMIREAHFLYKDDQIQFQVVLL